MESAGHTVDISRRSCALGKRRPLNFCALEPAWVRPAKPSQRRPFGAFRGPGSAEETAWKTKAGAGMRGGSVCAISAVPFWGKPGDSGEMDMRWGERDGGAAATGNIGATSPEGAGLEHAASTVVSQNLRAAFQVVK